MSLPQARPAKGSPWAIRIATVAGIPVRLHVTFLLFLVWLGTVGGGRGLAFAVGVFVCVLLHEFGHALTARRYGIGTRDITLYPIGGLAMLSGRMRPRQELWVALAGPAVNVVLTGVLWAAMRVLGQPLNADTYLGSLLAANVVMATFNMIPAFPMDGGRVLRALLARVTDDAKATQIAARIGQAIAVGFFIFGLVSHNTAFTFVAIFVFLGAGGESRSESVRASLSGRRALDAMQTRFRTMTHGASLGAAAEMLRAGPQRDFPVVANEAVVGVVSREDIAQGLAEEGPDAYVAGHMRREPKTSAPEAPLEEVVELLVEDSSPVLVMEEGHLVGMVTKESVGEFLMLEDARRKAQAL